MTEYDSEPAAVPVGHMNHARTPHARKRRFKPAKWMIALGVAALVLLVLIIYFIFYHGRETTDDASIDGRVIPMAPKVSGYVVDLRIDDNQHVKTGDVLLVIDPRDYQIALEKAQASLASAEARLSGQSSSFQSTQVTAPSNVLSARAQLESAKASLKRAADDRKRYESIDPKAISQQQLDQAVEAERTAQQNVNDAEAKLQSANTAPRMIAQAKANRDELAAAAEEAKAEVAQAQKDLNDTQVIAPADGRVTRRTVERGAYLQPGETLFSLIPDEMWITANFKETQLEHMRAGQKAVIEVDAYPDLKLHGHIDSLQQSTGARLSLFPPENATGNFVKIVQRVPVKIVLDDKVPQDLDIGPGMSVEPTVDVR